MTSSGLAIPPDQKVSQIRSTWFFSSPVSIPLRGAGPAWGSAATAEATSGRSPSIFLNVGTRTTFLHDHLGNVSANDIRDGYVGAPQHRYGEVVYLAYMSRMCSAHHLALSAWLLVFQKGCRC